MARYKSYNYAQMKMVAVSYERQILPGTFEHTLNHLIDHDIDLGPFAARYVNEETGAPAYDPAILLKVILYAYSRGVTSSRDIAGLCRENIIFMALSADSTPHFTTIAGFVAKLDREIVGVYREVLLVCDEMCLIGREMFAVDGVKMPSNASKEWSGTREDFQKKAEKLERALGYLTKRHREADATEREGQIEQAREKQMRTLNRALAKVRGWLKTGKDRLGVSGKAVKSNITDPESAKMKTSKGVIQGYDGMAVVDAKHQIVVHSEAFGQSQEHNLLVPVLEGVRESFKALGRDEDILEGIRVTADAGLHSEANLQYLQDNQIDGYVADPNFRKRDPRFAGAERYRVRHKEDKRIEDKKKGKRPGCYTNEEFRMAEDASSCQCPAGKTLYRNGERTHTGAYEMVRFRGAQRDCRPCEQRSQCLRTPDKTSTRQVAFILGRNTHKPETHTERMKRKIDTDEGRYRYSLRLGTVEPVFADINHATGLRRFSLRGRRKVNAQWMMFCLAHNIGKIQRYGDIGRWKKERKAEIRQ
ncbi:MAG: transposase [Betaproteobacteria bacterium]|nr:transposase [Betaproteobacteria bacterium]